MNMRANLELRVKGNVKQQANRGHRQYPLRMIVALAATVMFSALVGGCRSSTTNEPNPTASATGSQSASSVTEIEIPVTEQQGTISTIKLSVQEEPDILQFPGKIVLPDNESWRVGVLMTGRIERVYANLGDYVHKGDVLARMHSHDVHEARAAYAMAVIEKNRVESATSLAQVNFDRLQRLYALRAASVEQVEQARQELINSKTALQNAQIEVMRTKTHLEDNLGIPAELPSKETSANSELIPIIAPADGYVLQKNVTPGTTVAPATDIFVLGDLNRLWMMASVGQEFLSQLKVGQSASITLPGIPGQQFAGRIANLGQAFDPTTRRLQVRIKLEQTSNLLRPEMLATAEIAVGQTRPLLLVAPDAVQQVNGQDVVFVRQAADRFSVRQVRTGGTVNGKVILMEGVRAGDEVVTQGSFLLKSQLLKASMQGD